MAAFMTALAGGALLGATLALIGLGLVQAYRSTGTFNFAYGEMVILPALLLGIWESSHRFPFYVGLLLCAVIGVLIGIAMFLVVLRRTVGSPHFVGFAATLGAASVLDGIMQLLFGSRQRIISIPGIPARNLTVFGAGLSSTSLILAGIGLLVAGCVVLVMRYTKVGTLIRAAGQDAVLASQGGINVRIMYLAAWALAGLLATIAGVAYEGTTLVDPSSTTIALIAFPAIVLGGLDSIEGAVIGGILIGMVQEFTATYLGGNYTDLTTYGILLAVLLLLPSGFFGTRTAGRV